MIELLGILNSGLKIIQAFTDPDKKEKSFHLAMRKDARKALDVAEDIFELMDSYLMDELSEQRFKKAYTRLKSKFNDLD